MLTEHELWDAPLLVLANKQDEPRAATPREITEHLQLFSISSRNWYIIDTRATHPDAAEANLHAGLDWLVEVLLMPVRRDGQPSNSRQRPGPSLAPPSTLSHFRSPHPTPPSIPTPPHRPAQAAKRQEKAKLEHRARAKSAPALRS